jgi:Zn-dependent protease
MNCEKCGENTFMPFQCPYCGGQFCSAHRLPENHSCPKIDVARLQKQQSSAQPEPTSPYTLTITYGQPRRGQGRFYMSPKELKHLAVAALLVVGIGFSIVFYAGYPWTLTMTSVFAVILTASFLVHEMAHKLTAQRKGLWAEFRLTLWGAVLTLLSVVSPFKLVAPGAVMISGPAQPREIGYISIAGPAVNIIFSVSFLSAGAALVGSAYSGLFFLAALFNATIAIFNLIPFGILDGFKIFSWNKKAWALIFTPSVVLVVVAYINALPYLYSI